MRQVQNGINGTVTDSSGAVIAGARVTATNTSTGVLASAVTSSAGTLFHRRTKSRGLFRCRGSNWFQERQDDPDSRGCEDVVE